MSKWLLRLLVAALIVLAVVVYGTYKLEWFAGTGFSAQVHNLIAGDKTGPDEPTPGPDEISSDDQQEFNEGLGEIIDQSGNK